MPHGVDRHCLHYQRTDWWYALDSVTIKYRTVPSASPCDWRGCLLHLSLSAFSHYHHLNLFLRLSLLPRQNSRGRVYSRRQVDPGAPAPRRRRRRRIVPALPMWQISQRNKTRHKQVRKSRKSRRTGAKLFFQNLNLFAWMKPEISRRLSLTQTRCNSLHCHSHGQRLEC